MVILQLTFTVPFYYCSIELLSVELHLRRAVCPPKWFYMLGSKESSPWLPISLHLISVSSISLFLAVAYSLVGSHTNIFSKIEAMLKVDGGNLQSHWSPHQSFKNTLFGDQLQFRRLRPSQNKPAPNCLWQLWPQNVITLVFIIWQFKAIFNDQIIRC